MRRRTFLGLMGALAATGAAGANGARPAHAAIDRLTWWDPAPSGLVLPPNQVVLEWRYLAGRISDGGRDFGFVISLADYNPPFGDPPQLLVMRQDLSGDEGHRTGLYPGALSYDAMTATYTFTATGGAASMTWRYDSAAQRYTLSVTSQELTLSDLTCETQGELIPEGGTGQITTATFGGVNIFSDYHADWVALRQSGRDVGVGRLDMQTIRPAGIASPTGFSHHWFAVAADVGGAPAWISAYRLVSERVSWVVTIARRSGAAWSVESFTETSPGFEHPLSVQILAWQSQPVSAGQPPRRTGKRWLITAGRKAPGDLLYLTLGVAPGQFISGARVGSIGTALPQMQEAVSLEAAGALQRVNLGQVQLAVAESTFSELGEPPPPPQKLHLPLLRQ